MPAWVGPLHDLVEVGCLSGLEEVPDDVSTWTKGLSGRARARVAPQMSRAWSCSIDIADPSELGVLQELIWTRRGQDLWLVTEPARAQNVLPPMAVELDRARAVMVPVGWESADDLTMAGTVSTVDGVSGMSVLVSASGAVSSPVLPVVAGVPVTASVYVPTGGTVELVWVDATGVETSAVASSAAAASGDRVWVTATPTAETACRLVVSGASWFTRPQVTWTGVAVPWVMGLGAEKVHLGPLNLRHVMALTDGSKNLVVPSYTIREVG